VVLCESGGVNLPPNEAGASGYYQIVTSTWEQYGGHGAAAYLASKPEQDAVASRIWARGAGAPNWVCASVIGKG
jgi:muramidase (phage lysozyme)